MRASPCVLSDLLRIYPRYFRLGIAADRGTRRHSPEIGPADLAFGRLYMGYRNALPLRPHVGGNSHLMEMIGNSRCWHLDAWFYVQPDRKGFRYYAVIETRAGGRDLLQRHTYRLHLNSDAPMSYVPELPRDAAQVTLQDRDLMPEARDGLNALHWSHMRRWLERRPDTYKATSAAFHYVRAPSLVPLDGCPNFFAYKA